MLFPKVIASSVVSVMVLKCSSYLPVDIKFSGFDVTDTKTEYKTFATNTCSKNKTLNPF